MDHFDLKSAIGAQWSLAVKDKMLAESYQAVGRSYTAQREFRKNWATKQYQKLREQREKIVDQTISLGSYG